MGIEDDYNEEETLEDQDVGEEQEHDTEADVESGEGVDTAASNDSDDGFGEDLRDRASAYGLNPDLFETADALESQMQSIDQYWAGQARARSHQQQQRQPQQQQQQPQQQQAVEVPFKLNLDPNEYPPEMVEAVDDALKQIHQHYQPLQQKVEQLNHYIAQQHQQQQQQAINQEREQFLGAVKELNHRQLFGDGTQATTQAQAQNIARLYQEAEVLAESFRMRGMRVPAMGELVKRAEHMAFSDQLTAYKQQTQNARLSKQAKQRLGSGGRRGAVGADGDWNGDPVDNPKLHKAYNDMLAQQSER